MTSAQEHEWPNEPFDRYLTPSWPVARLLERVALPGYRWLEPAAGEGSIVQAVRDVRPNIEFTTVEIRESCSNLVDLCADFIWWGCPELDPLMPPGGWDVCITNPPFSLSVEFAEVALQKAQVVAFLQRADWAGGSNRSKWHQKHPSDIYFIPERIDFTGEGGDQYNYAWFVWGPGRGHYHEWLAHTPELERKASEKKSQKLAMAA